MLSINRFLEVPLPFEMTSKRDFESVNISKLIFDLVSSLNYTDNVCAVSNISEKAMTSAAMAERQSRFALYDMNNSGTT